MQIRSPVLKTEQSESFTCRSTRWGVENNNGCHKNARRTATGTRANRPGNHDSGEACSRQGQAPGQTAGMDDRGNRVSASAKARSSAGKQEQAERSGGFGIISHLPAQITSGASTIMRTGCQAGLAGLVEQKRRSSGPKTLSLRRKSTFDCGGILPCFERLDNCGTSDKFFVPLPVHFGWK